MAHLSPFPLLAGPQPSILRKLHFFCILLYRKLFTSLLLEHSKLRTVLKYIANVRLYVAGKKGYFRVVTRYVGSGITAPGAGIISHGIRIS